MTMDDFKAEVAEDWEKRALQYLWVAWAMYMIGFCLLLHGWRYAELDGERWTVALVILVFGGWFHWLRGRCLKRAAAVRSNHGKEWHQ